MKNIIIGLGLLITTMLMVFSLVALNLNTTKENDTESSLKTAVYQTLNECMEPETWPLIANKYADLEADARRGFSKEDVIMAERFKENLKAVMKTKDKAMVRIIASDRTRGILSVEASVTYNNMGKEKKMAVKKTVIYENRKG